MNERLEIACRLMAAAITAHPDTSDQNMTERVIPQSIKYADSLIRAESVVQSDDRSVALWVWWRGAYLRIIVPRDGEVKLAHSHAHDEGYHHEEETYTLEGEFVICVHMTDGSDCDGRLQHFSKHRCHISVLEFSPSDEPGCGHIWTPNWQKISGSQRDHRAEEAGY
jgi:hypothetical protein